VPEACRGRLGRVRRAFDVVVQSQIERIVKICLTHDVQEVAGLVHRPAARHLHPRVRRPCALR
jgi:hypothetical protein